MLSTLPLLIALTGGPVEAQAPIHPFVTRAAAPATAPGDVIEPALVRTEDKLDLRADYYPPRGSNTRSPAVLLIHDAGADRSALVELAESLQRAKFGVLALDLRGHGESADEEYDWASSDEDQRNTLWAFATRDVEAGARWLGQRKDLHSTNLTVIGVGAGGTLAVRHAVRDENVRGVGLIGFQPKSHGCDLASDLADIEGLPVMIAPAREQRADAESLVEELEAADWIEVKPLRTGVEDLLDDKRLGRTLVGWAEENAQPRRGGRR